MRAAIKIDNPNTPPALAPGEKLRGQIGWEKSETPEKVELRLFHFTKGRGTRDVAIVDTQIWTSPGSSGVQDFSFELPPGPYTFSGKLVAMVWALELVLHPSGFTDRVEFIYSPDWREIELCRYPIPDDLKEKSHAAKWSKRLEAKDYE